MRVIRLIGFKEQNNSIIPIIACIENGITRFEPQPPHPKEYRLVVGMQRIRCQFRRLKLRNMRIVVKYDMTFRDMPPVIKRA